MNKEGGDRLVLNKTLALQSGCNKHNYLANAVITLLSVEKRDQVHSAMVAAISKDGDMLVSVVNQVIVIHGWSLERASGGFIKKGSPPLCYIRL